MATPNIVPRNDSEGQLGTASKYWASAYIDEIYVGAGKIGRDADNLLDFTADNHLTLRLNANNKLVFDGARMYPNSNDGYGLGLASNSFSDLFLASGAVINFNNGNLTLTHSSNALTLADGDKMQFGTGGDMSIDFDGTNGQILESAGDLYITNSANDKDIIFQSDDGSGGVATYFYLDGSIVANRFPKNVLWDDNVKALFGGGSGDLQIYHDGSDSIIDNNTGHLYITNTADDKDIIFRSDDGSGGVTAYITLDGGNTDIDFHKNAHFLDNVNVKIGSATGGDLQLYHNGSHSLMSNQTGNLLIRSETADGDISFIADNGQSNGSSATYFFLDGSSATHDGSATTALYTNWPDKSRISLGTSHDLQIYHDGSNSYVQNTVGDLYIQNGDNDKDVILRSDDGSGGQTAYLTLDGGLGYNVSSQHLRMADGKALYVGDDLDGGFYHSSGHNFIENNTGNLTFVQNTNDGNIIFQSDDGSGGTETYFYLNGSTGYTEFSNNIHFVDNVQAWFGNSGDFKIYHDGSNSYIQGSGTGDIIVEQRNDDKDIVFNCDDGSGGTTEYFRLDGSATQTTFQLDTRHSDSVEAKFGDGSDFIIKHTGDTYLSNTSGSMNFRQQVTDGDMVFQCDDGSGGDATYFALDGGIAKTVFSRATLHVDGVKALFGSGGDLEMYHDGTDSYITNSLGHLVIGNDAGSKDIIFKADNGSGMETYFQLDGSARTVNFSRHTFQPDGIETRFGTDNDLKIYHDSSNSYIEQVGTGNLIISTGTDDGDIVFKSDNGSGGVTTYLTLDGGDVSTIVSTIKVMMPNLPTSDPGVTGQLWNDSGTLKIS